MSDQAGNRHTIRAARPSDYEQLARIYAETAFAHLPELQRTFLVTPGHVAKLAENAVLIVAESDGLAVAGIGLSAHKSQVTPEVEPGEIQAFWYGVHPDYQGQGIGRSLITAVLASLQRTGNYSRLIGQLLETRHAAIAVAESCGAIRNPNRGGLNDDGDRYHTFEIHIPQ